MNKSILFQHFYYSKLIDHGNTISDIMVTACSKGINAQQAATIFASVNLGYYRSDQKNLEVFSLRYLKNLECYVLSHIYPGLIEDRGQYPEYHCMLIPIERLVETWGNFTVFTDAFFMSRKEHVSFNHVVSNLPELKVDISSSHAENEIGYLNILQNDKMFSPNTILGLLSYLIISKSVNVIHSNFPLSDCLNFLQGMIFLLPHPLRHNYVTFVTNELDYELQSAEIKIKFLQQTYQQPHIGSTQLNADRIFDWNSSFFPIVHPYASFLASNWHLPSKELVHAIYKASENLEAFQKLAINTANDDRAILFLGLNQAIKTQLQQGDLNIDDFRQDFQIDTYIPIKSRKLYQDCLYDIAKSCNKFGKIAELCEVEFNLRTDKTVSKSLFYEDTDLLLLVVMFLIKLIDIDDIFRQEAEILLETLFGLEKPITVNKANEEILLKLIVLSIKIERYAYANQIIIFLESYEDKDVFKTLGILQLEVRARFYKHIASTNMNLGLSLISEELEQIVLLDDWNDRVKSLDLIAEALQNTSLRAEMTRVILDYIKLLNQDELQEVFIALSNSKFLTEEITAVQNFILLKFIGFKDFNDLVESLKDALNVIVRIENFLHPETEFSKKFEALFFERKIKDVLEITSREKEHIYSINIEQINQGFERLRDSVKKNNKQSNRSWPRNLSEFIDWLSNRV